MHREPLRIRPAHPQDAVALSALAMASKAHWGYSDEFMEACRNELSVSAEKIDSGRFAYFVADMAGELVGFYGLEQIADFDWELEALFVAPNHIGQGIGRALIEHAKPTAAIAGAKRILIQGDPHAQGFYLAVGAQLLGERESASIPGRYLPFFEIPLVAARS